LRHKKRSSPKTDEHHRNGNALLPVRAQATFLLGMAHTSTGVRSPMMVAIVSGVAHENRIPVYVCTINRMPMMAATSALSIEVKVGTGLATTWNHTRTMGDATRWGESSAAVGMAATPSGAHKAGLRIRWPYG